MYQMEQKQKKCVQESKSDCVDNQETVKKVKN